jgi:hypothetical protein
MDLDLYRRLAMNPLTANAPAEGVGPEELGSQLAQAWAEAYWSRIPQSSLLEFDSDGARFLFDLAVRRAPSGPTAPWPPGDVRGARRIPGTSPTSEAIRHREVVQSGAQHGAIWWLMRQAAPLA